MQITRLRYERIKRGWTQQEVAEKIGVTKYTIHSLEVLKRKPSYDVLIRLCELFGVHDVDLFQLINADAHFSSYN